MPINFWKQNVKDVLNNPYDYEAQRKFLKEARVLLDRIYNELDSYQLKFHVDDRSVKKAVWMLINDALDTLRDCLELFDIKKHRIVAKMFRDVVETMDLATLFCQKGEKSRTDLNNWYNDVIIPHRRYREFLKSSSSDPNEEQRRKDLYSVLSKWTHHSYISLKYSYSLGAYNMLVYDSHHPRLLVLPRTISEYMWIIAQLIKMFIEVIKSTNLIDKNIIDSALHEATKNRSI